MSHPLHHTSSKNLVLTSLGPSLGDSLSPFLPDFFFFLPAILHSELVNIPSALALASSGGWHGNKANGTWGVGRVMSICQSIKPRLGVVARWRMTSCQRCERSVWLNYKGNMGYILKLLFLNEAFASHNDLLYFRGRIQVRCNNNNSSREKQWRGILSL